MKKFLIIIFLLVTFCVCYLVYNISNFDSKNTIYIVSLDDESVIDTKSLYKTIKKIGKKAKYSHLGKKYGDLNLFVSNNYDNLPKDINKNAINILWLPYFNSTHSPELLRDFDVIVVKSASSFEHLKAINVRTAYIPDAINIKNDKNTDSNGSVMYLGNGEDFSLALMLTKNINIDVYGKVLDKNLGNKKIKKENISDKKLKDYSLILVDQTEENISKNLLEKNVIKIIENNALPFVRYNPAIEKIFSDAVPMYYNNEHFYFEFNRLLKSPDELERRLKIIKNIAKKYNSESQANKFIEIFDIMKKKRIKK